MGKRYFGSVRKLRSGRFQARYHGPDGRDYTGPVTFDAKSYASAWLDRVHGEIQAGTWQSPRTKVVERPTVGEFAEQWLASRDLSPKTRVMYRQMLNKHVLPGLGSLLLADVDQVAVEDWYARLDPTKQALRAHCYMLLRTILNAARRRRLVIEVPSIPGAGAVKRQRPIRPLSIAEVDALADAIPRRDSGRWSCCPPGVGCATARSSRCAAATST